MPGNVANLKPARSDQPMLVEVVFVGPKSTAPIPLQRDFFESFTVTLSNKSAWKGNLTLFDRSGDFILSLVAASGSSRTILLRWGWDDGRGIEVYPQYVGKYVRVTPEFTAQGARIEFELVSTVLYDQAPDKKPRDFKAGTKVSDIVQQIATERKWKTKDRAGLNTIETTDDAGLDADLVQRGESDFKFIHKYLVSRAENPAKRGPYRFFVDDSNAVHFHTDEFLPLALAAKYLFAQDAMGDVIEFAPQDNKFFASLMMGAAAVFWSIDSLTGQRVRLASTDIGGLPGAKVKVETNAAFLTDWLPDIFGIKDFVVSRFQPIIARTQNDFERKVRARFEEVRNFAYVAGLTVRGTHAVLPTQSVRVDYFTPDNVAPHFLSGVFFVREVEHEVSGSGWQTQMQLHRRGIQFVEGALALEGTEKVTAKEVPETQGTAPNDAMAAGGQVPKETRATRSNA